MNQQNYARSAHSAKNHQEEFFLDGQPQPENNECDEFSLETQIVEDDFGPAPVQENLFLDSENSEHPEESAQFDLDGMGKPVHQVAIHHASEHTQNVTFQHAHSLLESLESQDIPVQFQCREGYCGSCRTQLLEGEVHYTEEPMAWINDDEILPCCCIPKTAIRIKLP
jgi:ferredoxin